MANEGEDKVIRRPGLWSKVVAIIVPKSDMDAQKIARIEKKKRKVHQGNLIGGHGVFGVELRRKK